MANEYKLTKRESEVLKLIVSGMSNKEIGKALNIALSTVKIHIAGIFTKLETNSRVKAAVIAVKKGVV